MIVGEGGILIKNIISVLMKNNLGNIKECRTLVKHKKVMVNGMCLDSFDYIVNEDDRIFVDGIMINANPFIYYLLNKPKGYLSASYDQYDLCVTDLIDCDDCHCIGRLDRDTTGLLLLTNDKSLSKRLLLPNRHIKKIYEVKTRKDIDPSLIEKFKEGVIIDKIVKCKEAILEIVNDRCCNVTLYEGKYHQIKKMFLSCDNEVIALKRIAFSKIRLDSSLKEGEFRKLTKDEIKILYR
ncbi:MAG: RNA pseudouridine synthase [Coprobacillus sp.]